MAHNTQQDIVEIRLENGTGKYGIMVQNLIRLLQIKPTAFMKNIICNGVQQRLRIVSAIVSLACCNNTI